MYRKMDAQERLAQLQQIAFQLDVLEGVVAGPFVAGARSLAGNLILTSLCGLSCLLRVLC